VWLRWIAVVSILTSTVARAACLTSPVAAKSDFGDRFEAVLKRDKFRDVPGNIVRWQALIATARQTAGVSPLLLARSYGWLAWSLDYLDQTDAALVAAKAGMAVVDAASLRDRETSDIVASLSMVETDGGKVDAGVTHATAALAQATTNGPDSAEASFAHNALAAAAYARGNYAVAEREYGAATDIAVRCLNANDGFIVNQMASHAGVLYMVGRSEDALAENERAANWALSHLDEDNPVITLALGNLGVMLRSAGRYAEAEAALRRVVDLEGRYQKDRWYYRAISLSNFASVIDRQGRHAEAEALWLKASEFHARATMKSDPVMPAYPWRFSADAAEARGDLLLALNRRETGLRLVEKAAPADHPEVARARIEYALTLTLLHRASEGLAIATPAIAIVAAKLVPGDVKRLTAEIAYARIVAAASGAEAGYTLIAPIAARLEAKLLDTSTSRGDLLRYGPAFSASFAAVTNLALATHRDAAAFHALQLANMSDVVLVSTDVAVRTAAHDPAAAALVRSLQDHIHQRQGLDRARSFAASANAPADLARIDTAVAANDTDITAITRDLDRTFPAFRALGRPTPVPLATFAARLAANEILLAPLPLDDGTLAIGVTRDGLVWRKSTLTRSVVEGLVQQIRAAVTHGEATPFPLSAARELYDGIVPPGFADHSHALYYTSGPLASVPPALLAAPDKRGRPAWLIDSHSVTVQSTLATSVAAPRPPRAGFLGIGAPILAVADGAGPVFGATVDMAALRDLPALPRAEDELRQIARLLGSTGTLLVGAAATEANVKAAALDRFGIIAIATHGLAANDVVGLSEPALVLTTPAHPRGDDDGLLTASEIAALKIDADWVILSACNTAGAVGAGSPAYSGLASAFLAAGARALLVSQWPVRDDTAAALTVATLRLYQGGLSRDEALARAMRALMHDKRIRGAANPAVWAPFVLIDQ
jgi:CHAT domain-containing protein/tetratricopeptide (TPR) repeat protein